MVFGALEGIREVLPPCRAQGSVVLVLLDLTEKESRRMTPAHIPLNQQQKHRDGLKPRSAAPFEVCQPIRWLL